MYIRLYEFIENTMVEGPGLRDCIFVQGCMKKCPKCNSKDSWDINKGKKVKIKDLASKIIANDKIEGVTFSGGEPFLQSRELYKLGLELKKHDLSIVTFTGYTLDYIQKVNDTNWNKLLSITDILMDGRFDYNKRTTTKAWVGSTNQQHHFLTDRYSSLEDKLDEIENKIEIRLSKNGKIIVNGMGDNKRIKELFKGI